MKSFTLSLALFAGRVLASGGPDTSSPLNNPLDFGDGSVAPTRMEVEHVMLAGSTQGVAATSQNNEPENNGMSVKFYTKSNDTDRTINEVHGEITLTMKVKPATGEVGVKRDAGDFDPTKGREVTVGFYWGKKTLLENEEGRRFLEEKEEEVKTHGAPESYEGAYATFTYNA